MIHTTPGSGSYSFSQQPCKTEQLSKNRHLNVTQSLLRRLRCKLGISCYTQPTLVAFPLFYPFVSFPSTHTTKTLRSNEGNSTSAAFFKPQSVNNVNNFTSLQQIMTKLFTLACCILSEA